MSSVAATAHRGPPEPVPVFPIPELSLLAVQALRAAGLDRFYELNREDFTKLVSVVYVGFMERSAELRKKKPASKKLLSMFCAEIRMFLTAARPQWESLQLEKPEKSSVSENGLAAEFLWNHVKKEKLLTWQDFYADGKQKTKVVCLVNDFVHFVVAKVFEQPEKVTFYISDESNLREARQRIQEINRGDRKLKPL